MLISKVVEGYHSTIFAYGHTSAGKTYTMEGTNLNAKRALSASDKVSKFNFFLNTWLSGVHTKRMYRTSKSQNICYFIKY